VNESAASSTALEPTRYSFGPFHLDVATRALYRGSEFVALTPKAAEILLVLLREAGRVVTKEQLLEEVWPGLVVEEGAIASNVSALRKVLDAEFGEDGPIATVPRRGYRFAAAVAMTGASEDKPAAREAAASAPLITERDTVLVAEIDNQTGEAIFDGTLRQALLLHLAQSPFLEVLTDRKVRSLLGYLGKQGAKVAGEVALEVCQRSGSKAVITGAIFAVGEDFVIGLQALDGESGDVLVTEQARARGKAEVLHALDQAAIGLRTKLGESLASVKRFSQPFDEVATASLEAFRAYSLGRIQWSEVGENAGIPHLRHAIELDPDFASAYSALSLCCNNLGLVGEAGLHMQKAYELRERATERERIRIIAGYHDTVSGDVYKGIDAHRLWERSYPRDAPASTNLGNLYAIVGQWEKSLASNQRGHSLEPTNISTSNLAIALLANGRHDEARAILEDGFARGFGAFYLHLDAYQEAFLRGDMKAMQRHVDAVSGRAGEEDYLLATQADTEAFFGRHERARDLSRRAIESAQEAGVLEMAALWAAQAAMREAELGERARAAKGAQEALEIAGGRYVHCVAGYTLARAGEARTAEGLVESLVRDHPHTAVQRYWIPCIRAALAMNEQRWKEAVDALEPALAVELGLCMPFECGFMLPAWLRGLALKRLGRAEEAAAELTKIVEKPGLVKNYLVLPLAQAELA
jgi:DNA-binding winged helix-turn-helix (wHTH) protein/tetratricopeptide (TPR) repeat protein